MWRDDPHFVQLKITPKTPTCQKCGCECENCGLSAGILDYHHRIEQLERDLREYKECSSRLETQMIEVEAAARNEQIRRDEEMARVKDRYDRLMESHKKLSRLNQTLEDQLLSVVTKYEGEKSNLMEKITASHSKLEEAKQLVIDLELENKRCKTECSIAVQLLQTRPNDYVAQKLGSLPDDLRERLENSIPRDELMQIKKEMEEKQKKAKPTLTVMPTFPPCAAMFSAPQQAPPASDNGEPAPVLHKSRTTGSLQQPSQEAAARISTRHLARVISETSLRRKPADEPVQVHYLCVRCRGGVACVERAAQTTMSRCSSDDLDAAVDAAESIGEEQWESGSARHVHRSALFSSSSFVSAGPYSGAILDV